MSADQPLPEVAVNFALTWDARVTTRNRTPSDFSSPRDKQRLLQIRATGDALLVGKTTLETENMQMRLPDEALRANRIHRGQAPFPIRVVVTNSGCIEASLRVFENDFSPILIFSTTQMPQPVRDALAGKAVLHLTPEPRIDLHAMLGVLRKDYAVERLVCEGGATLFRSLLQADLVDEINLTFCPRVFGGIDAPTLTGVAGEFLPVTRECRLEHFETVGSECFAKYRVEKKIGAAS